MDENYSDAAYLDSLIDQRVVTVVRIRPFTRVEFNNKGKAVIVPDADNPHSVVAINPHYFLLSLKRSQDRRIHERKFIYDHVFWSHDSNYPKFASQAELYHKIGEPLIQHCLRGFNCCVIAYGQTGSGKTYTMFGKETSDGAELGLIPRLCDGLLQTLSSQKSDSKGDRASTMCNIQSVSLTASYYEVYNDRVYDLLSNDPNSLCRVREDPRQGAYIENLTWRAISNYTDISKLLIEGSKHRSKAATLMNASSSRSHVILSLNVQQKLIIRLDAAESTSGASSGGEAANTSPDVFIDRNGRISLVDLAGSERASSTGVSGDRLKEANCINKSLLTLGNIIKSLADKTKRNIAFLPYRDSLVTWLLKGCLGGNCRTTIIANVCSSDFVFHETVSTLKFVECAKLISNRISCNDAIDEGAMQQASDDAENSALCAVSSSSSSSSGGGGGGVSSLPFDFSNEKSDLTEETSANTFANDIRFIEREEGLLMEIERLKAKNQDQEQIIHELEKEFVLSSAEQKISIERSEGTDSSTLSSPSSLVHLIQAYKSEITSARKEYCDLLESFKLQAASSSADSSDSSDSSGQRIRQLEAENLQLRSEASAMLEELGRCQQERDYANALLFTSSQQPLEDSTILDAGSIPRELLVKERDLLKKALNSKLEYISGKEKLLVAETKHLKQTIKNLEGKIQVVIRENLELESNLTLAITKNKEFDVASPFPSSPAAIHEQVHWQQPLLLSHSSPTSATHHSSATSTPTKAALPSKSPSKSPLRSPPALSPQASATTASESQRMISGLFNRCRDLEDSHLIRDQEIHKLQAHLARLEASAAAEQRKAEAQRVDASRSLAVAAAEAEQLRLDAAAERIATAAIHRAEMEAMADRYERCIENVEIARAKQFRSLTLRSV